MKTKIILNEGWKLLYVYDFPMHMNTGDSITFQGKEYTVYLCHLDITENFMEIIIKE